jgi:hypothetical protein
MRSIENKIAWFFFAFFAIGVSLYPLLYGYLAYIGLDEALRSRKTVALLANVVWNTGFYTHISFGGLALLVGWVQFSKRFRNANLKRHRTIGKIYMIAVLISGLAGLYIAFYATGGLVAKLGFVSLALVWLYTTSMAYQTIKNREVRRHEVFMIYSYAACFAAVTLRIWLPLLTAAFGDFIPAYRIVAWLCWVPNIVFAYFWVKRKNFVLV